MKRLINENVQNNVLNVKISSAGPRAATLRLARAHHTTPHGRTHLALSTNITKSLNLINIHMLLNTLKLY